MTITLHSEHLWLLHTDTLSLKVTLWLYRYSYCSANRDCVVL